MFANAIISLLLLFHPRAVSRDSLVVEAGLLSLFEKSDWNTGWTKGDFVVVKPEYGPAKEWNAKTYSFSSRLEKLRHWQGDRIGAGVQGPGTDHDRELRDRAMLTDVQKAAGSDPDRGGVGTTPLEKMGLDPRIVVDAVKTGTKGIRPGTETTTNAGGQVGTIRAVAILEPPSFSGAGDYAILIAHCYRNACDLIFLLQATRGHWRVRYAFVGQYLD